MKRWKEVTSNPIDMKKEKGRPYEGEYLGKDEIATPLGTQFIYRFRDEHGNPFAVYGFTNLNRAMENLAIGTDCRLTYTGTQNVKTKFGMKDVHMVRVEISEGETTEGEVNAEVSFP